MIKNEIPLPHGKIEEYLKLFHNYKNKSFYSLKIHWHDTYCDCFYCIKEKDNVTHIKTIQYEDIEKFVRKEKLKRLNKKWKKFFNI